jgi:biopolymer transport protein ExbD
VLSSECRWQKAAQPNLKVFIGRDREARYGQVIQVMDVVRQIGISQVALERKWKEPPEKI